jgi:hypothetical protein
MCSGGDLLSGSPTTPAEFQGICTKFLEVAKTKFKTLDFEVFDARAQGRALAALLYPVQVDTKEVNDTSLQAALVHVSLLGGERERERGSQFSSSSSLFLSLSRSLSRRNTDFLRQPLVTTSCQYCDQDPGRRTISSHISTTKPFTSISSMRESSPSAGRSPALRDACGELKSSDGTGLRLQRASMSV